MKKFKKATLLAVCFIAANVFAADKAAREETLAERVKAVGELCMAGDPCAAAMLASSDSGGEPRSGETVYNTKCSVCHATGAANAPKFKDKAAWSVRIAAGMETLYVHAIKGINTMPAKGLCMDCSDDEIKAAVDYMIDAAK